MRSPCTGSRSRRSCSSTWLPACRSSPPTSRSGTSCSIRSAARSSSTRSIPARSPQRSTRFSTSPSGRVPWASAARPPSGSGAAGSAKRRSSSSCTAGSASRRPPEARPTRLDWPAPTGGGGPMCGIGVILNLDSKPVDALERQLALMNTLQAHRGPDGEGRWKHDSGHLGFAHRRLEIIDLETGQQPMHDGDGNWITYNGEIYNYVELRRELGEDSFRTTSDTEVVLRAYRRWGPACVERLRGMFAFAVWDETEGQLFCARDRFGIKPFAYAIHDGVFYGASEAKALLPFLPAVETDLDALKDYLAFQFCLAGKTLFKGVRELLPGHALTIRNGVVREERYWEIEYEPDFDRPEAWFTERLRKLVEDSVQFHLRADVPVGAYLSGGLDSSITTALASDVVGAEFQAFTGRFAESERYDETRYARLLAEQSGFRLHEQTIGAADFVDSIRDVVYHLDYPIAGPGSFPQYMVSRLAAQHMKVVLGGQGGDEIF